jgi:hypothetical protein
MQAKSQGASTIYYFQTGCDAVQLKLGSNINSSEMELNRGTCRWENERERERERETVDDTRLETLHRE